MLRYDRQTNPGLVAFYDIRPETERVYSYNPGARKGPIRNLELHIRNDDNI